MTTTLFAISVAPTRPALALLCAEARYLSVAHVGASRLDRRFATVAQWQQIDSEQRSGFPTTQLGSRSQMKEVCHLSNKADNADRDLSLMLQLNAEAAVGRESRASALDRFAKEGKELNLIAGVFDGWALAAAWELRVFGTKEETTLDRLRREEQSHESNPRD